MLFEHLLFPMNLSALDQSTRTFCQQAMFGNKPDNNYYVYCLGLTVRLMWASEICFTIYLTIQIGKKFYID